jgi:hypothetical protein
MSMVSDGGTLRRLVAVIAEQVRWATQNLQLISSIPFSSFRSSLQSWRPLSLNCKTTPQLSESEQSEFLSFITFASCLGKRCVSLFCPSREKKPQSSLSLLFVRECKPPLLYYWEAWFCRTRS